MHRPMWPNVTGQGSALLLELGLQLPFTAQRFRVHTKGLMQQHATLRKVLRRFSNSKRFLEGFLEGTHL